MNVALSLSHPSSQYVEWVYDKCAGKVSALLLEFNARLCSAKPWQTALGLHRSSPRGFPRGICPGYEQHLLLPKNINSAPTQTQISFFPAAFDNLPMPWVHPPAPNTSMAQCARDPHTISEHNVLKWVIKEMGQSSCSFPTRSQLLLYQKPVFICHSYRRDQ